MLTRFLCWFFNHDDHIVKWDDRGMVVNCQRCGRHKHHPYITRR